MRPGCGARGGRGCRGRLGRGLGGGLRGGPGKGLMGFSARPGRGLGAGCRLAACCGRCCRGPAGPRDGQNGQRRTGGQGGASDPRNRCNRCGPAPHRRHRRQPGCCQPPVRKAGAWAAGRAHGTGQQTRHAAIVRRRCEAPLHRACPPGLQPPQALERHRPSPSTSFSPPATGFIVRCTAPSLPQRDRACTATIAARPP